MRLTPAALLLVCLGLASTQAHADKAAFQRLLQKNNCTACHAIDKKKYGPKFTDVAGKYADDPAATDYLMARIRSGGTGVWGKDIMPPQPQVSDEDARAIVERVLSLELK